MSNTQTVKSGVDYIVNSKKPYPEWLRGHTVFKEMPKIDKVFPKIGLPNFKEPCDIMNSAEALAEANFLGTKLTQEMGRAQIDLYKQLDTSLSSNEKDRNDRCAKIQGLINLIGNVVYSMNYRDFAKVEDGRVVMKLRADVFGFSDGKAPVFRKNEAVLRVVNKLWDMLDEVGIKMTKTDQYAEFKNFSRVNIPNKQYTLVFSSSGEEGAWDIGTISMRGVTSCQSWNAPQSRGLIGSIASKFVGVIYLSSDQQIPGYGSKMLNRSLVRFAINKHTKKPALILDRMYPNHNKDTFNAFKKALSEKSGLEVHSTYNEEYSAKAANIAGDFYIPEEPSRTFLKAGEFSYMDFAIPVAPHSPSIKKPAKELTALTNSFKKNVCEDICNGILVKREMYIGAQKTLDTLKVEFEAAKKKWEEESASLPEADRKAFELKEPKLDQEIATFGKGGIMNLLTHCDKKHGANSAGKVFANMILDSIVVEDNEFASKEEYHRKYLMSFLKNSVLIKEVAKKKVATGTWMKSFPKSADKFFDVIFSQMRGYFIASCKEMIKKSN